MCFLPAPFPANVEMTLLDLAIESLKYKYLLVSNNFSVPYQFSWKFPLSDVARNRKRYGDAEMDCMYSICAKWKNSLFKWRHRTSVLSQVKLAVIFATSRFHPIDSPLTTQLFMRLIKTYPTHFNRSNVFIENPAKHI